MGWQIVFGAVFFGIPIGIASALMFNNRKTRKTILEIQTQEGKREVKNGRRKFNFGAITRAFKSRHSSPRGTAEKERRNIAAVSGAGGDIQEGIVRREDGITIRQPEGMQQVDGGVDSSDSDGNSEHKERTESTRQSCGWKNV